LHKHRAAVTKPLLNRHRSENVLATRYLDSFDPAEYKDTYTNEVQKLIEAKAKGQKREAPAPKAAKGNVIDLVAALQESLGNVKKRQKTLCCIAHPLMVKMAQAAQAA
jgi:non-homologous end joining protein Ku